MVENGKNLYDLEMLKQISQGNEEFVKKMITIFIESVPTDLENLKAALEDNDLKKVGEHAHKLKPSFDTLNISVLKEKIRALEASSKAGDELNKIEALVQEVIEYSENVIEDMKVELESL